MSDKKTSDNVICLERLKKLIDKDTRENIAKAFGCDTSLITKHYTGKRDVTAEYIVKYAKYFNVSADYLLGLTEVTTSTNTEEGQTIREICDYTGLSEKAVEELHSCIMENKHPEGHAIRFNWKFDFLNYLIVENLLLIACDIPRYKNFLKYGIKKLTPMHDSLFQEEESKLEIKINKFLDKYKEEYYSLKQDEKVMRYDITERLFGCFNFFAFEEKEEHHKLSSEIEFYLMESMSNIILGADANGNDNKTE